MSDDLKQELAAARAELARLREAASIADRRNDFARELAAAGCGARALADAVELISRVAKPDPAGGWQARIGETELGRASLRKIVDRFLDDKPYLRGGGNAPSAANVANAPPNFEPPRYADGTPIPVGEWSTQELFEAAGDWPDKQPPKLYPVRPEDFDTSAAIEAINADTSTRRAEDRVKATFSPKDLAAMSSDELFSAAGEFPKG